MFRSKKAGRKQIRDFSAKRLHRRRRFNVNLVEALEHRALLSANVLSNHYTAGTTGETLNETVLTPANVNSTSFGKVFTTTLDGQVYAQILAVANVNITRGTSQGIHNVLYVATQHDSLYAIDANTGAILWQDSFLSIANPGGATAAAPSATAGVTTIPGGTIGPNGTTENALVNSADVGPELGILATPTIDPNTGILYLVADTQELRNGSTPTSTVSGADWHFVQRLWAVNISDGSVAITPINIAAEPTTGGKVIGDVIYNPTTAGSNPSFSSYNGYKYVVGPYVKGSGDNGDYTPGSGDASPADGWVTSSGDAGTPWGNAGKTPIQTGYVVFNALLQMNRVATTLINGEIYLGFASHGDDGPYYGWLLGYSASTLANNAAFVTVPNFEPFAVVSGDRSAFIAQAGFWNAGSTITTDGTYLYISSGNGAFNPNTDNFNSTYTSTDNGHTVQMPLDDDYGDTVLKLQFDLNADQSNINLDTNTIHNPNGSYDPNGGYNANGYGIKVVDYFTPSNVFELNKNDEDIGSGGVLLIPSTGSEAYTAHYNSGTNTYTVQNDSTGDPILVTAGKEGRIYMIDANNLGGYNTQYITDGNETTNNDPAPYDNIIGEFYYYETTSGHSGTKANTQTYKGYDIPSYFNGEIYVGLGGGSTGTMYVGELGFAITSFPFTAGPVSSRTGVEPSPNFISSNLFGGRGTTAAISANGLTNGVIWNNDVTQSGTDYLAAYAVSSSGTVTPIYTSNDNAARDSLTGGVSGATGVKFSIPTVFNGMVYDGTGGGSGTGGHILGTVVGYGLITPPSLGIFTNDQDIGGPSLAGSSNYNTTTGVYTVAGGGNDISGTSDQFQYLYETLSGDGSITAQVTSITNTNSSAKAGIMFRNSLTANSTDMFLTLTPSTTQGAKLEGRSSDGGSATIGPSLVGPIPPYWLRLTRVGNVFTAYASSDGITWTTIGSVTETMNQTVFAGLAVSSHAVGSLNTSTFQNVSVLQFTTAANATPSTVTGTSTNLNAAASENGSGAGITYTWAATSKPGGSNPNFSVNGTNAAQNTTVTFDAAGNYTFLVTATDAAGASITSSVNVTVSPIPPSLSAAISRKTQGSFIGDLALALSGNPTIEPRLNGPTTIILTFAQAIDTSTVNSPLSLTLSSGSGSAAYVDSTHVAITVSGAIDGEVFVVNLSGVRSSLGGTTGNYALNIGVLMGDIDGSGAVNVADVAYARLNSGVPVSSANFLDDIDGSGAINVADISYVKAQSGDDLDYGNITSGGDVVPVPELTARAAQTIPTMISSDSVSSPTVAAPLVSNDLAPAIESGTGTADVATQASACPPQTATTSDATTTAEPAGSTSINFAPLSFATSIKVAAPAPGISYAGVLNDSVHSLVLAGSDFLPSAALPLHGHKKSDVSESNCEDAFFDSLGSG